MGITGLAGLGMHIQKQYRGWGCESRRKSWKLWSGDRYTGVYYITLSTVLGKKKLLTSL